MLKAYIAKNTRFIKFLFIGGFNTLMSILLFYILIHMETNYLIASCIVNVFGVSEGYILNATLVYHSKLSFKGLFKYSNFYIISFGFNLLLMYIFVSHCHLGKMTAQFLTIAIATLFNYNMIKRFVFKI